MKKNWLIGLALILILLLIGGIFKDKFLNRTSTAAISISTNPRAVVFIDGVKEGETPYLNDKIVAGEHKIKLVPEKNNLVSWEGKVDLIPNVLTVVNRNLGENESLSSGEIIWLEKIAEKEKSSLVVVSNPDQAVVKIEGEPKGFTPINLENLSPGSYQIVVSSPGYEERTIPAKTISGYKLIINVQLAKKIETAEVTPTVISSPTPTLKVTPTPKSPPSPRTTPLPKPYVKIKETPTGWLRVRSAPSTSALEVAKVYPNETFPYLQEEKNGWYKIEYQEGKEGWVSGVYADLVE